MLNFKNINGLFFILFIGLLISDRYTEVPFYVFVLLFSVWIIITSIGSFNISWNYHLKALNTNKNHKEKQVAITFDDGPNLKITPQVLQLLETFNAKATFFCIGKQIEQHPEILKEIFNQGHTIGNHTYSHSPDRKSVV